VPRFGSKADEASWWDRDPDFIADQFEKAAKEGTLVGGVPKSQRMTIRIRHPSGQNH